tara:strand:+ start:4334 stop:4636 length:303 start_codon:yes stop_codon:yes gene_type:complete
MKVSLITLFIIGLIFSFANKVSQALLNDTYKEKGWRIILPALFLKSMLGGSLSVMFFYGIGGVYPGLPMEFLVGGSSVAGFMSEEVILILLTFASKRSHK